MKSLLPPHDKGLQPKLYLCAMKKMLFVAGLGLACILQNCSTDFDLNADFKETPVIYALLSASDSVHYIRINRAYLSDETDAISLAADPNAIYYGDELSVTLEELSGGGVIDAYLVERVDGDTLGIPKNTDGIFASLPNVLYRFKAKLNTSHTYKITVTNTETGVTAFAQTGIIDSFEIKRPDDESIFPQSVLFNPNSSYQLRWRSGQNAKFYDLALRFHYREANYFPEGDSFHIIQGNELEWKFETSYVAETTTGGLTLTYEVDGQSFFNFIKNSFNPVADNYFFRFADSVQFIIDAGGQVLYDYYLYNTATLGLTEGQITGTYTNVTGGLGIFSTRFHNEGKIYPFTNQTIDSIACGTITSGLNFAPDETHAGFPYCE
jgi:hypothetical protein